MIRGELLSKSSEVFYKLIEPKPTPFFLPALFFGAESERTLNFRSFCVFKRTLMSTRSRSAFLQCWHCRESTSLEILLVPNSLVSINDIHAITPITKYTFSRPYITSMYQPALPSLRSTLRARVTCHSHRSRRRSKDESTKALVSPIPCLNEPTERVYNKSGITS